LAEARLTPRAEDDLYSIWSFIADQNLTAADMLVRRLLDKAQLAAEYPMIGVARPELSASARVLLEGRYVIIYEPADYGMSVIAIVHGMRDPAGWM
jgi:toxin ParE1/3/4